MNTLILYKSKWGTTKLYAEWIHEAYPQSVITSIDNFDPKNLVDYDNIIIGSRTYVGRIQIGKFLVSNWNMLKDKNVYLFSVGMTHPDSKESKQSFEMLPKDIRDALAGYIKLPGKVDYNKLNILQKSLAKRHQSKSDKIDRDLIQPVIDFLKRISETENNEK